MIPTLNRHVFLCISLFFMTSFATTHADEHPGPDHCTEMAGHELGSYTFPITTAKPEVQKLFNEGINWAFGFHHAAAKESFMQAAAMDPNCAMCFWGIAYVLGPNINAPMTNDAVPEAFAALSQAQGKMKNASPREQALIRALAQRYSEQPVPDRTPLDKAYAAAMKAVAQAYPDDIDLATLSVEAVMDTMPWNYWTPQGEPREGTEEMIATLKRVLEKNPVHPGAIHFLIHVVERERPELAEQEADRLVTLVPGAGHLVHMASHIYIRVGRYHDAARVNEEAIAADKKMMEMCPGTTGFYQLLYVPHNYEFLAAVAGLEGRQSLAQKTADALRAYIEPYAKQAPDNVDLQQFWSTPLLTAVRFQNWTRVLKEPAPEANWSYAQGLWHFARAIAFARLGQVEDAKSEVQELEARVQSPELQKAVLAGLNPASAVLTIGLEEARGELAFTQKHFEEAIQHLQRSIAQQDSLMYIEPPAWYHSERLSLGRVYQKLGRYADAAAMFQGDLKLFPKNGWALFGLYRSMVGQQNLQGASQVYAQFQDAWQYADTSLGPDQSGLLY